MSNQTAPQIGRKLVSMCMSSSKGDLTEVNAFLATAPAMQQSSVLSKEGVSAHIPTPLTSNP